VRFKKSDHLLNENVLSYRLKLPDTLIPRHASAYLPEAYPDAASFINFTSYVH